MPDDGATRGPASLLKQIPAALHAIGTYPGPLVLVFGLALVFISLVERAGPYEFKSAESLWVTRAVGSVAVVGGIIWMRRAERRLLDAVPSELRGQLPAVALDPEFLLKVLVTGMPPAFVKEYTDKASGPNFLESDALARIQDRADHVPLNPSNRRRKAIKADHRAGDVHAAENGVSRQLEVVDTLEGEHEHAILTTKHRVDHRGKTYIVGWAVPVDRDGVPPGPTACLKDEFNQVVFRLVTVPPGNGVAVDVGRALRRGPQAAGSPTPA